MGTYVPLLPLGASTIIPNGLGRALGMVFSFSGIALLITQPVFGALLTKVNGSGAYLHGSIYGGELISRWVELTFRMYISIGCCIDWICGSVAS
jgi:hypothetical protein